MEITGSHFPPILYPATSQTGNHPQRPHGEEPIRPTPISLRQTIKPQPGGYEPQRKRFYTQDKDLPHSTRSAINSYVDSDIAGGPELMNRVDVYA